MWYLSLHLIEQAIICVLHLYYLDTWSCKSDEFRCGSGTPVCLFSDDVCDGIDDCMEGKDEDPGMCGEC